MTWTEKPRPRDAADELVLSYADRRFDLEAGGGLPGIRAIRRRYRLVAGLKRAAGGRPLTDAELDLIVPPVGCRRTRHRRAR